MVLQLSQPEQMGLLFALQEFAAESASEARCS